MKTLRLVFRHRRVYLGAGGILALGIGMSVAMFSLVDAVLLRPLAFPDQKSIQVIWKANPLDAGHIEELAYPELGDLERSINDFEYVALMPTSLYGYGKVLQVGSAEPVEIESAPVSHDFFRVLGVTPAMGRDFTSADERVGAPPVVILSDRVWRDRLAADRGIVGRMIRLNGQGSTVIGVMAPDAGFPRGAGLWVPLGIDRRIVERRGATFLQAIARTKPGRPRDGIRRQVNALFERLAVEYPQFYSPSQRAVITPLVEYWTGSARLHLWIMLGASLLLLIAAILSAGNLLLSRTLSRRTEISTRMALGASRLQILRQLAAEGAAVAILAATAGMGVAEVTIRFLTSWSPGDIPRLPSAALDLDSFCFAACAAMAAALACSLIPGHSITRNHLESALREGGARLSLSRRSRNIRSVFILCQAATTVMSLAMAALLLVSYRSMMSGEIGFANRDAVSMNLTLRGPGAFSGQAFDPASRRAFYARLLNRLRESPGVTSAAAILLRPLEGTVGWDVPYEFEFQRAAKELPKANYEVITPGYFETVGTPLLEGRDFTEHDSVDAEPVVIVSRALAGRIRGAGFEPLGHRMRLGIGPARWSKVVGVSADARYRSVTEIDHDIFVPYLQAQAATNYLVIRGTRPVQALTLLVRQTLAGIDPNQAVSGVATIGDLIRQNTARHRFNMLLLVWFGICALILAVGGIYSVIAETMAAREREIVIKTALGAQRFRLTREMISGALGLVVLGEMAGIGGMAALSPLASDLLYGVSARDPVMLGSVGLLLFLVSLAAASWAAWMVVANADARTLR